MDVRAAAMAYADGLTDRPARETAISTVTGVWAKKDPQAATTWAKQLPHGQLRDTVLNSVIASMAANDPAGALELNQSLNPGNAQQWSMNAETVFQHWAARRSGSGGSQGGRRCAFTAGTRRSLSDHSALRGRKRDHQGSLVLGRHRSPTGPSSEMLVNSVY